MLMFYLLCCSDLENYLIDGLKAENLSKKAKEKREAFIKRIKEVKQGYDSWLEPAYIKILQFWFALQVHKLLWLILFAVFFSQTVFHKSLRTKVSCVLKLVPNGGHDWPQDVMTLMRRPTSRLQTYPTNLKKQGQKESHFIINWPHNTSNTTQWQLLCYTVCSYFTALCVYCSRWKWLWWRGGSWQQQRRGVAAVRAHGQGWWWFRRWATNT